MITGGWTDQGVRSGGKGIVELVRLTHENIDKEHICCAISNNKDVQVLSKKNWLKDRLDEGLVFLKGNVRGKCFIEYIPASYAWAPVIHADDLMYIDCLWVSGQFKGHGYADLLLEACIEDSRQKGKKGLAVLSSEKKMGFLSDPGYMKYKGFETADTAKPFELLYLPFEKDVIKPCFQNTVREHPAMPGGFVLYYTNQCPFTAKYVPLLEQMAKTRGVSLQTIAIQTRKDAQNAPSPFTAFSLFYDGQLVTHEILSEKKFDKILVSKGL